MKRLLARKQTKKTIKPKLRKRLLEKKVITGARKALAEYGRVFKRLAEYDQV